MRIAHVCVTEALAGTERYVADVAQAQSERGHDVTVVAGAPLRKAVDGLRNAPGGTLPKALRSIARLRCDVVHCHLTYAEACAVLTQAAHGGTCVSTRHIARQRGTSNFGRLLRPLIERRLALEIAISDFVAEAVQRPCVVLPNGVQSRADRATPMGRVALLAQRLEPEKSSRVALEAWLASDLPRAGWRLDVAGDGFERTDLERLAAGHPQGSSVRFLGLVSDVESRLRHAAVVIAPASVDGLGLTVLEAMAEGTVVVAAQAGGHLESLPSDYPFFFDPGDVVGAARRLDEVARDYEAWSAIGHQLQVRQREHFSTQGHVTKLLELYATVTRS